jgi:multidrug transporter EmrE-like cation transporter
LTQILMTAVLNAAASFLLKKANSYSEPSWYFGLVGGGLLIYGLSFLCYIYVLRSYEAVLAYTCITGLSIVFLSGFSFWLLGEAFPAVKLLGMALIFLGITLLAAYG